MTEKLKPCPFCGNKFISMGWGRSNRSFVDGNVMMSTYYMVTCGCGATMLVRMKNCDDDDDDLPTATEAARIATERWNKRTYCTDDNLTMNI